MDLMREMIKLTCAPAISSWFCGMKSAAESQADSDGACSVLTIPLLCVNENCLCIILLNFDDYVH